MPDLWKEQPKEARNRRNGGGGGGEVRQGEQLENGYKKVGDGGSEGDAPVGTGLWIFSGARAARVC